jgi:GNAT superfamily N-acetyltransferase
MDPVIVREAGPSDRESLVAASRAMAAETEGLDLDPATLRAGTEAVLAAPGRGFYLVAEAPGGAVVGQLMVTTEWSDWRCGWFWWIQSVYVQPAWRGRGVYRALHREVERRARARGDVAGLRLYVAEGNRGAQAVYRAVGLAPAEYRMFEADWVLRGSSGGA